MKYAKLINQYPMFAPNPILHAGLWYGNPPGEIYEAEGYKPVRFTPYPEPLSDTGWWVSTWTEDEQQITQAWTWCEPPIS